MVDLWSATVVGSFRLVPPEPKPDVLVRPRLLRSLAGRWEHRVTSVVGGAGLGKTTLLAQAILENRLAPRGDDLWVGVERDDADAERLARQVATALASASASPDGSPAAVADTSLDPAAVADAVWHRAPTEVCIHFDDVHLVPAGSSAAAWLADLVVALPANGHLVFASRSEPPVRLTRIGIQGGVLQLGEDDLRFSADELAGFARQRGLDVDRLGDTGGWPAMAELVSSVGRHHTGRYLWEEILEPLGALRRHVLSVLIDLAGGDDQLISAALGSTVELDRALDGVPLVGRGADGWHVAHGLWRTAPGLGLDATERGTIRKRAVENLIERGRYDEAFSLVQAAGPWDAAEAVLRSACLAGDRLAPAQLRRWLAAADETVRRSLPGRLAVGLHASFSDAPQAFAPLDEVMTRAQDEHDLDVELTAMTHLGILSWWQQDLDTLGRLANRAFELEPTGHPLARAFASIARAGLADLVGDDSGVVAELGGVDSRALDSVWRAYAGWLCGMVELDRGNMQRVLDIVEHLSPVDRPLRYIVDGLRIRAWWRQGRVDDVLGELPTLLAAHQRDALGPSRYILHVGAGVMCAYAGEVVRARGHLDDSLAARPPGVTRTSSVGLAAVTAGVQLCEGEEDAAAATLRELIEAHGLDEGPDRRYWRQALALSYVLVPETRKRWHGATLRGFLRQARDLSAAVVALRDGRADQKLRDLDLSSPGVVRAALPCPFAAELAVGLAAAGRAEGRTLIEAMGAPGRAAVRSLARGGGRQAKAARALLAAVPSPPPRPTYLAVLGPLELRRDGPDGEEVVDSDLRRRRVQELVAFLVAHRRTTRAAIGTALWPDMDERTAANNLGVTVSLLLKVLEPWRAAGDPAFLVRLDGQAVQLASGEHLRVDVDAFDEEVALATRAEAEGVPSVALQHHLAAMDLYRGDLHADMADAGWLALDREHYRTRFVATAVRAGQLLTSRGDVDQADTVAHRALAVDPWSEDAYAVLVTAALTRHDRSAARRLLTRCFAALADLGVDPTPTTLRLHHRVTAP